MNKLKVRILDRDWKFTVLSGDSFQRQFKEQADGFTFADTREVVLNEDELSLDLVLHELTHVFFDSMCVSSAALDLNQQEEVFAVMNETYGAHMHRLARKIYRELTK